MWLERSDQGVEVGRGEGWGDGVEGRWRKLTQALQAMVKTAFALRELGVIGGFVSRGEPRCDLGVSVVAVVAVSRDRWAPGQKQGDAGERRWRVRAGE